MDIAFRSRALEKACNDFRLLVKAHGEARAKLIRRRLDALRATVALEDLRNAPGRLHELKGSRRGQLSLDLDGPYRIVFVPAHDPAPERPAGGMDWSRITAVIIIGIEDTHD